MIHVGFVWPLSTLNPIASLSTIVQYSSWTIIDKNTIGLRVAIHTLCEQKTWILVLHRSYPLLLTRCGPSIICNAKKYFKPFKEAQALKENAVWIWNGAITTFNSITSTILRTPSCNNCNQSYIWRTDFVS